MRIALLFLGLAVSALASPVLVELFTSEGCSSCPPADQLLAILDQKQPIPGAQLIVLSEHVDYWNHDGWKDPFSSAAFTTRQEIYARRFGLKDPYTPEMVVDGTTEFVGSDTRKAEAALVAAAHEPKTAIHIVPAGGTVTIEANPLPAGAKHKANVYAVVAANSATSDVLRGENSGRKLSHVAVAGQIRQIGKISEHAGFTTRLPVPNAGSRLVVFVQESDNGRVWGAAMYATPK